MSRDALPQRQARIPDETAAEIVRLAIRQMPQTEIARRTGVHRQTVRRVLRRTQAAVTITADTETARAESVAVYREVQRTAWDEIESAQEKGRSTSSLLAEVRQTQQRIDALLGLAVSGPDDPAFELQQFKATVVSLIHAEAPELGPRLAQRLLEMRDGGEHAPR